MNIFQINRSDIEDRFDPKYILYLKDIHNFKYDIFPLKRFLIEKPQYGQKLGSQELVRNNHDI